MHAESSAAILVAICFALIITCLASPLLFSPRHAMRDLRRCFHLRRSHLQFRLRTLLLAFGVVQLFLALMTWRQQHGEPLCVTFWYLAFGSLIAWAIWSCLSDTARGAGSRKWKNITRPQRIVEPGDEDSSDNY